MIFPSRLFPGEVICRLPMTRTSITLLNGVTESGIAITTGILDASKTYMPSTPSQICRQFYLDLTTDKNGQTQAKVPVVVEAVKICEDCEDTKKRKIEVGKFYGIKNFSIVDYGIDTEEGTEKYYWYFSIDPRNLRCEYDASYIPEIYGYYEMEDVYLTDTEEMLKDVKKIANQQTSTQMPIVTINNPLVHT